jgi:hypothetical protein
MPFLLHLTTDKSASFTKIFFHHFISHKEDSMSHNPTNAIVLALVLGVCSVGFAGTAEDDKATKPETTVVAEKAATPGIVKEVATSEVNNVLSQEETVACGDLSKEPHDFNFDLDDDDDDDDTI